MEELIKALNEAIALLKRTTEFEVLERYKLKVKEFENVVKKL